MSKEKDLQELLNGSTSAEEQTSLESNSLIEYAELTGTPFMIVEKNGMVFLTWGEYMITPPRPGNRFDIPKMVEEEKWNVQAAFTLALIDKREKNAQQHAHVEKTNE